MNYRAVCAIVRKDLKVILQSKAVLVPLIVVPIILFVALPILGAFAPLMTDMPGFSLSELNDFMQKMPAGLEAELSAYEGVEKIIVLALVYMLAPMFLIVPLMVASVIAADSFAGEKERKTLEALLYTPTEDRELFLGKMLSAFIPAFLFSVGGAMLYALVANIAAWPTMGRIFMPNAMWVVMALWVGPAAAGLGLGTMVLVSSRVSGFQEAYQLGSAVVLPIVLLMFGQISGVMYFNLTLVLLLGVVLWAIDAVLLWFGVRTFQRGELIARL